MTRPLAGAAVAITVVTVACGPPSRPALPSGAGTPFPGFLSAYEQAVQECAAVQAITAELGLSGRAGGTKLRGKIVAGLAAPADIVLEGVAPFGRPVFVLAGRGGQATLVLPRDKRVLEGEKPEAIIEALAGVRLTPAELRAAVSGCGLAATTPSDGRSYGDDWAAVDSSEGTMFLRRIDGRWRVAASTRDEVTVQYSDFSAGRPSTVFVRTPVANITLRVSQVEINVPIDPRAFDIEIPANTVPLTIEELRRAGPLGDKSGTAPNSAKSGAAPKSVKSGAAPDSQALDGQELVAVPDCL